jgi:hypothetical protein
MIRVPVRGRRDHRPARELQHAFLQVARAAAGVDEQRRVIALQQIAVSHARLVDAPGAGSYLLRRVISVRLKHSRIFFPRRPKAAQISSII